MKNKKGMKSSKKGFPVWGWALLVVLLLAIVGALVLQPSKPAAVVYPAEITVTQTAEKRGQGRDILVGTGFTRVTSLAGGVTE
ncbi:MAG: hypothetical protein IMZ61_15290 [Planctomycetes bacterium]|nr:hypothetical protein [Planctomycetota bacterium]